MTNGQLQRRLNNALLHIDKTKETKSVFFDDKGLRITINEDYALVETNYHRHVFSSYTISGVSKPWLYVRRLVDTAIECGCDTYAAMTEKLKNEGKTDDYNFVIYVSWWLFNIFQPLYSIGNTDAELFLVYESYMHNIARSTILLSEHDSDLTNKQFVEQIANTMKGYMDDIPEEVFLKKKTDEEIMKENIDAEQAQAVDEFLDGMMQMEIGKENESKDKKAEQ